MTIQKSIIIGSIIIALAIVLRVDESISLIPSAEAEVAGMDRYDLIYDWDFRGAVEDIIEDCDVDGEDISC